MILPFCVETGFWCYMMGLTETLINFDQKRKKERKKESKKDETRHIMACHGMAIGITRVLGFTYLVYLTLPRPKTKRNKTKQNSRVSDGQTAGRTSQSVTWLLTLGLTN